MLLNRKILDELALNIATCYYNKKVSLASQVKRWGSVFVKNEIQSFLEKYMHLIQSCAGKRGYALREEKEDCVQFVCAELIKAYHRKESYSDWDRVVKSIVKRKVIDYSKARTNDIKGLITESCLATEEPLEDYTELSDARFDAKYEKFDVKIFFEIIKEAVDLDDDFDQWERAFAAKLVAYAEAGVYDIKLILAATRCGTAAERLLGFAEKLRNTRPDIIEELDFLN